MRHTFDWGMIAGYKHFFSPNTGVRIYGNLNLSHSMLKDGTDALFASANMLINYTINADFLYNFYSNNNGLEVGAFAGLGLGGISAVQTYTLLFHTSINNFDIGLNMGLRASVFDNHSLEFAVYVPFLPISESNYYGYTHSYRHAFSMLMRYVYSFDFTKKQTTQKQTTKYRKTTHQPQTKNIKQPDDDNSVYDEYDEYY